MDIKVRQRKDSYFEIHCRNTGIVAYNEENCTGQYWQRWLARQIDTSERVLMNRLVKRHRGIPIECTINELPARFIVFKSPKDAQEAIEEYIIPKLMIARMKGI